MVSTKTTWDLHASARRVYVSKSGSDANDGLSTSTPKLTIAAGYALIRDGFGDQLLLNRGDTWTGENIGDNEKSGLSASYPFLIGSYGTGARPRIVDAALTIGRFTFTVNYIAVQDLDMERTTEGAVSSAGLEYLGNGDTIVIENCKVRGYNGNLNIQARSGNITGLVVRGCVIAYAYNSGSHASGAFFGNDGGTSIYIQDLLIEDCFFVHNGFDLSVPAYADIRAQNCYVSKGAKNVTFRRNWSQEAAASGVQLRRGGTCFNNTFLWNPISLTWGHNENTFATEAATGTASYNVINFGADLQSNPETTRGVAIWIEHNNGTRLTQNLVAELGTDGDENSGIRINDYANKAVEIDNNVVFGWDKTQVGGLTPAALYMFRGQTTDPFWDGNIHDNYLEMSQSDGWIYLSEQTPTNWTFANNQWWSPDTEDADFNVALSVQGSYSAFATAVGETGGSRAQRSFTDSSRTILTYATSLGDTATQEAVRNKVLAQDMDSWDSNYTPEAFNAYMRAGFDIAEPAATKQTYFIVAGGVALPLVTGV